MSDESIVVGTKELALKFEALDDSAKGQNLVRALKSGSLVLRNAIVENIKKQGLVRSRTLSRSVHEEVVEQTPERAAIATGTDLDYAAIHEFGGVIKPKEGKYLAIPIGSYVGSPRRHSDLKLRKTGAGNLILIDASGVPQYVLKTSVTIPARPYMRPAADENQQKVHDEVAATFTELILKAAAE